MVDWGKQSCRAWLADAPYCRGTNIVTGAAEGVEQQGEARFWPVVRSMGVCAEGSPRPDGSGRMGPAAGVGCLDRFERSGTFRLAMSTPSGYSMPFWDSRTGNGVSHVQQTNRKLKRGQQRAMWYIFAGFVCQFVSLFF